MMNNNSFLIVILYVLSMSIDIQASEELIQMDTNEMMTYEIKC